MAVLLAIAANGVAASTTAAAAGDPTVIDPAYLPDFAEDLTLAMGKVILTDLDSKTALKVVTDSSHNSLMQADTGDAQLQVLPLQVLNQAINRAILASASESPGLDVPADDAVASQVMLGSEDPTAVLFPSVEEVFNQWDARYSNVARAETPSQLMQVVGNSAVEFPEGPDVVTVRTEGPSERTISTLADTEFPGSVVQARLEEARKKANLPGVESALDANQSARDDVGPPIWSMESPRLQKQSGDSSRYDSVQSTLLDTRTAGPAINASSVSVHSEIRLDASNGYKAKNVGDDPSVQVLSLGPSTERSNYPERSPSQSGLFVDIQQISTGESLGSVELRTALSHVLIDTNRGTGASLADALQTSAEGDPPASLVEPVLIAEAAATISVVSSALAGQTPVAIPAQINDLLPSLSNTTTSAVSVLQSARPDYSSGNTALISPSASRDVIDITAMGVPLAETMPLGIPKITAELDSSEIKHERDVTMPRLSPPTSWLDHILGADDVAPTPDTRARIDPITTFLNEPLDVEIEQTKIAQTITPGLVVSRSSLNSSAMPEVPLPTAELNSLLNEIANDDNEIEPESKKELLDFEKGAVLDSLQIGESQSHRQGLSVNEAVINKTVTTSESRAQPEAPSDNEVINLKYSEKIEFRSQNQGLELKEIAVDEVLTGVGVQSQRQGIDSNLAPIDRSGFKGGVSSQLPVLAVNEIVILESGSKSEFRSQRQGLNADVNTIAEDHASIPKVLGEKAFVGNPGDTARDTRAKDNSETPVAFGVVPQARAVPALRDAAEQADRQNKSIESDDFRTAAEFNLTNGEHGSLSRATIESGSLAGLSSALGISPSSGLLIDRLGLITAQSQVATLEAQSANPLLNSVSIEVKQLLTSGGGSVLMQLTPPEQGVLQLDLVVSDSGVATLEVYGVTEALRERLESGSTALQRQFEQMGLTLSLSLFDHGKGFSAYDARTPQLVSDNTSEVTAEQGSLPKKHPRESVGDGTGRMINLIA